MTAHWWLLLAFGIFCVTLLTALVWYRREDCRIVPPEGVSERDWLKVTAHIQRDQPAVYVERHLDQQAQFRQKNRTH